MNFLGSLIGAKPPLSTPGFAGPLPGQQGMPGFDMPAVAPFDQQLNIAPPPPQAPRPKGGGLNNVLGTIGDVLLAMSGGQAMYGPQKQARERRTQMGAALTNYLGQSDPALAELAASGEFDVADLVNFRKLTQPEQVEQPEVIRLMRAAGIDPASEEGRALIQRKLGGGGEGNAPNFVRELEALGIDPRSDEARELYYGRNSPAGYLLRPRGGGAPAGGGDLDATPTTEDGYSYTPGPGGRANKANWKQAGGPTAGPSAGFP